MKDKSDLVAAMFRKAESDLRNADLCLAAGEALDTACFHAQQAAEKALKAYLTAHEIEFPFIHNIEKLVDICAGRDPSFRGLLGRAQELTPYAVELRYDAEFWPTEDEASRALALGMDVVAFVRERLPKEFLP